MRAVPGPARIVEGDAIRFASSSGAGWSPPPGGELDDPLLDHPVGVGAVAARAGVELTCGCRGGAGSTLDGGTWTIRDPLGLALAPGRGAGRRRAARAPADRARRGRGVRRRGARQRPRRRGRGGRRRASARRARSEFEVDGLRPYREGSPASRIHWPARRAQRRDVRAADGRGSGGRRRWSSSTPSAPTTRRRSTAPSARRRRSASTSRRPRAARCCCPATGRRRARPRLRGWPALHAQFAVVDGRRAHREPGRGRAPRHRLLGDRRRAATGAGPGPRVRPRAPTTSSPPAAPGRGTVAFTVAGCSALAVGRARSARRGGRHDRARSTRGDDRGFAAAGRVRVAPLVRPDRRPAGGAVGVCVACAVALAPRARGPAAGRAAGRSAARSRRCAADRGASSPSGCWRSACRPGSLAPGRHGTSCGTDRRRPRGGQPHRAAVQRPVRWTAHRHPARRRRWRWRPRPRSRSGPRRARCGAARASR